VHKDIAKLVKEWQNDKKKAALRQFVETMHDIILKSFPKKSNDDPNAGTRNNDCFRLVQYLLHQAALLLNRSDNPGRVLLAGAGDVRAFLGHIDFLKLYVQHLRRTDKVYKEVCVQCLHKHHS